MALWKAMSASIIALTSVPRAARRPASISAGSSAAPAFGRQARGQRVDRAAHFVDLGDLVRVERGDDDAAAGRVVHQAVLLQQAQRLQHRLARDRQLLGDLFLRQPGAGRERSLTYRIEQRAVDALDEIGSGLELDELSGHGYVDVLDSVYRVPRPTLIASPGLPCSNAQAMTEKLMNARIVEAMMIRATRPLSAP